MLDSDWTHWAFRKQTHCHSEARSKACEKGGMGHWCPQHKIVYHSLLTVLWECQHRGWTRRVACPFQTGSDTHCGKCCLWNGHSGWRCALQFLQLVYCSRWTGRHTHTTQHQSTCPVQCFTYTVVTHTHTHTTQHQSTCPVQRFTYTIVTHTHTHTTQHQSTCPVQRFTYTVVTHTHTQHSINLHVPCNASHTQ